jgi:GT2 family glycosyltransferase
MRRRPGMMINNGLIISAAAHPMAAIQVVVVLYKRSFHQSESLSSFAAILKKQPPWAQHFSLLVYDNSPQAQVIPEQTWLSIDYIHDSANSGLAAAYNSALAHAEEKQCEWLLLLDQDTTLSGEFIGELLQVVASLREQPQVGAIVPKLLVQGNLHSPAQDFITQLRAIRSPGPSPFLEAAGTQQQHLVAYNSGSVLRVPALRAIGGFPAEFWLDFLDHAVFHQLFEHGYRVYILQARLRHDFSESDIGAVPVWRQLNVLQARNLYLKRNGSMYERLLYRVWLLRHARSLRRSGADPQAWRSTAFAALWMQSKHKH